MYQYNTDPNLKTFIKLKMENMKFENESKDLPKIWSKLIFQSPLRGKVLSFKDLPKSQRMYIALNPCVLWPTAVPPSAFNDRSTSFKTSLKLSSTCSATNSPKLGSIQHFFRSWLSTTISPKFTCLTFSNFEFSTERIGSIILGFGGFFDEWPVTRFVLWWFDCWGSDRWL